MKNLNLIGMKAVDCSPNEPNVITIPSNLFNIFIKEKECSDLISTYILCSYLIEYEKLTETKSIMKTISKKFGWSLLRVEKNLRKLLELGSIS
jgi:hypothetical protein